MLLMFGKNLKKIRSVHGLSQQEFADIFELKRGTLGAYEEGRSNPKLEMVVKIANHFSIGLEELLVMELTVNKLLKFNERLTVDKDSLKPIEFIPVPCVLSQNKSEFIKTYASNFNPAKLSTIQLPFLENKKLLAFSVDDLSMTSGGLELFPKDIVIGEQKEISTIEDQSLVVLLTDNELLIRKIHKRDQDYIFKADHYGVKDLQLSAKEIIALWKVEHIFNYTYQEKQLFLENRLNSLEESIAKMEGKKF